MPHLVRVHTAVEPGNAAMNAVNQELGFQPVELLDEWQTTLTSD